MSWLILKGDLMSVGELIEAYKEFTLTFMANETRKRTFDIYEYEGEDLPMRLQNARKGL